MLVPLHLRGGRFPNRVVRSVRTETDGPNSEDRLLVEIGGRAREGPGLVMAGPVAVSAEGRITPVDLGIYCDEHKALWKRLVEFVHTQSSALIGLQLNHAGPRGSTESPQTGRDRPLQRGGWPLLAVSPLPYAPFGDCPNEVSPADMEHLCDQFVRAALAALDADIDLLELHFGHGYLVAGFISPLTNRRSDRYGGSIENRLRFPLSILEGVREVWPDDRPLSVCFSLTDWAAGGTDDEDAIAIARALKHAGCDLAHVVTGQTIFNANPAYGRSWEARYSDLIRNEAEIPTMTGGNITTSDDVNTMLAAGRADLCIVDPPYLGQIEAVLPRQTPLDHLQQAVRPR